MNHEPNIQRTIQKLPGMKKKTQTKKNPDTCGRQRVQTHSSERQSDVLSNAMHELVLMHVLRLKDSEK